ncbi:putative outer membrane starch-binding protein [Mucilaginibacter gracilis]|uniref:Putative outer membrane starch-binding protein n=1 Tax=Mucilaginibacter gracilis TaxID=423350 RepID=A0A495J4Y4_9SPHI|nr:RagB/SusD family nutrient uptake outer membrane protein [Mucilaginibacter gracilis]RKR84017.1 putative outer membrane starch-binding protein [Mucilaginibacter gracilis]
MKKIIYSYFALVLLLNAGCKKFLKEQPYSVVSTENFYKTPADAELAITGVYDILNSPDVQGQGNQPMWGRSMEYLTSMGCDELIGDPGLLSTDVNFLALSNYTYTSENTLLWYTYFALYAGINRANLIIERVPAISMDATRKKTIVAEAYFMRGLFYSYLGWLWGGVPLADSSIVDSKSPRATMKEIMDRAEFNFKYAYNNLPARNTITGRVNKYTAAAFLTKLYLYIASCKENNVGQGLNFPLNSFDWVDKDSAYQLALQYAKDAYSNSGYKLIRPFNYLFLAATETTARDEHMMIVQAGAGGNQEYIVFTYLAGPTGNATVNSGTYGWVRPVKEGYLRFNTNDGRRALSFSGSIPSNAASTVINGYTYYTPAAIATNLSNICINKWREDDPVSKRNRGIPSWAGETDYGILRFADIILMYAEARFKTGDEAGARSLLREIRLRACNDNVTQVNAITTAYLKTDFMQELLDERSRELLCEGWRRFDLIRTNKLQTVVAGLDEAVMFPREDVPSLKSNFKPYKIWYPIPSRDLATNPNLIQNPGY